MLPCLPQRVSLISTHGQVVNLCRFTARKMRFGVYPSLMSTLNRRGSEHTRRAREKDRETEIGTRRGRGKKRGRDGHAEREGDIGG